MTSSLEVSESSAQLPAGLRFQVRRPLDDGNDLRSEQRKTARTSRHRANLPKPTADMSRDDLIALADARGVDTGKRPTKAALLNLLSQ